MRSTYWLSTDQVMKIGPMHTTTNYENIPNVMRTQPHIMMHYNMYNHNLVNSTYWLSTDPVATNWSNFALDLL